MKQRTTKTELLFVGFLFLFVLPAMLGAAAMMVPQVAFRLSLGYLGGVWYAWTRGYQGTPYYQGQQAALAAFAAIVRETNETARATLLEAWLASFDPLGIVRDAIARGTIEERPTFER